MPSTKERTLRASHLSKKIILGLILIATLILPAVTTAKIKSTGPQSTTKSTSHIRPTNNHLEEQQWFYSQRAQPNKTIPANAYQRALQQRASVPFFKPSGRTPNVVTGWTTLGPAPTLHDPNGVNTGVTAGRITSLAYDAASTTLYAGAANGGVWKTINNGTTWTPLSDTQATLAIGALALDPANSQIIYAGTGEQNFGGSNYTGSGVLKSTDGGSTWTLLGASTFKVGTTGYSIGKIAVDPHNSQHVLAASGAGFELSTDSGTSWTTTLNPTQACTPTDFALDGSSNPSTIYVACGSPFGDAGAGIYKSTDGGATFGVAPVGMGLPTTDVGRMSVAIAPSSPQQVYALIASASNNTSLGVWYSSNGGTNWTQVTLGKGAGGPDLVGNQGFYGNTIAVDPNDPTLVYTGGVDVYKATNGGSNPTTFTRASFWDSTTTLSAHADHHRFLFYGTGPSPRPFFEADDGGVYGSTDGTSTWIDYNGNLNITQFYGGSTTTNFTTTPVIYAGAQDNGNQKYDGTNWTEVYGGDGGYTATDPANPNTSYEEYTYLEIHKTTDGGSSWPLANSGLNASSSTTLFIAPFIMDTKDANHLLAGTDRIFETTDGAGSWTQLSTTALSTKPVTAIAIAPSAATTTFYAATKDGKLFVTQNHGTLWTDITAGTAGASGYYATSFAVNPTNSSDVVVTFSGFTGASGNHVYRSTNAGAAWTDISAGLPDAPVNSVVRNPSNGAVLYVGTDTGFYFTLNGGTNWQQYQTNLPNTQVMQIFPDSSFTNLIAVTFGRGAYSIPLSVFDSQVVTQITDDGTGNTTGSLSYAFTHATAGSSITFNLTTGNTIVVSGALPSVPVGVNVNAVCNSGVPSITIDGSALTGNGLTLSGQDSLNGLWVKNFSGLAIKSTGQGNHLTCVRASR